MNASKLKKRYGHNCTLENEELFAGTLGVSSVSSKIFLNTFYSCFSISDNNKRFSHYCRSQYRLRLEKIYHVTKHPFKIHPISTFRVCWEVFIIFISVITLICVPMTQTFFLLPDLVIQPYGWHYFFKLVLNAIFWIDIIVNFQTGYYDDKCNIVFECKRIALHYVKGRFICDLLSSIPDVQPVSKSKDHIQYFSRHILILFPKTLRVVSLITYTRNVGECFGFHNITIELIQLFGICAVVVHWTACIIIIFGTFGIGLLEHNEPMEESWLALNNLYNSSVSLVYITSLYRTACFLSGADYSVSVEFNQWDMVMKTVCWIISKTLFGVCIGFTIQIARSTNSPTILFRRKLQKMLQYADQKQINLRTTKRIIAFYEFKFRNKFFKEKDILRNISPKLRNDLLMFNRLKLLRRIDFFKGLPETLLTYIGACLRQQYYLTGDIIVNANQKGDGIYLILTGTVVFYTVSGIEYTYMYDGQYFGEVEMIVPGLNTICTVVALEASEIYFLSQKDFHEAIGFVKQFPEIIQRIQQHIDKRISRVKNIEERFIQMQSEKASDASSIDDSSIFLGMPARKSEEIRKRVAQLNKEAEEERIADEIKKNNMTEKKPKVITNLFESWDTKSLVDEIVRKAMVKREQAFPDSSVIFKDDESKDPFASERHNLLEKVKQETADELTKKLVQPIIPKEITEPETNVQILKEAVRESAQKKNEPGISVSPSVQKLQEVTVKNDKPERKKSALFEPNQEMNIEPMPEDRRNSTVPVLLTAVNSSSSITSSTSIQTQGEQKKEDKRKRRNRFGKEK